MAKIINQDGKEDDVAVGGMVVITQPRRVAAITLAHRVAREMGSPLIKGAQGAVGYSVRFDTLVPIGAKIKFVTEGMLLQEMLHDPNLRKYEFRQSLLTKFTEVWMWISLLDFLDTSYTVTRRAAVEYR